MACASEQDNFQQWLAQINQVCGRFAARPLEGAFLGELHPKSEAEHGDRRRR